MKATINLRCSLCREKFVKVKAEVTFQDKKWVAAGKSLPKPYFCSRKCGQHYSGVTYDANRSLKNVANTLRKREAEKYRALHRWLKSNGVKHRFEHVVGSYIFDLAIKHEGRNILVEFDSRYHECAAQLKIDRLKDATAKRNGWELHRVYQPSSTRVPTRYVKSLVL